MYKKNVLLNFTPFSSPSSRIICIKKHPLSLQRSRFIHTEFGPIPFLQRRSSNPPLIYSLTTLSLSLYIFTYLLHIHTILFCFSLFFTFLAPLLSNAHYFKFYEQFYLTYSILPLLFSLFPLLSSLFSLPSSLFSLTLNTFKYYKILINVKCL